MGSGSSSAAKDQRRMSLFTPMVTGNVDEMFEPNNQGHTGGNTSKPAGGVGHGSMTMGSSSLRRQTLPSSFPNNQSIRNFDRKKNTTLDMDDDEDDSGLERSVLFDPICVSCGQPLLPKKAQCRSCGTQNPFTDDMVRVMLFHSNVSVRHSRGLKFRKFRVEDELKKTSYLLTEVEVDNDPLCRMQIATANNKMIGISDPHLIRFRNWKFAVPDQSLMYYLTDYWNVSQTVSNLFLNPTTIFGVSDVVRYGIQLFQALDALHRNGIIHGGIRNTAVVISENGLMLVEPSYHWTSMTMRIGAGAAYLAPEAMEARKLENLLTQDVWACGCILAEMCRRAPVWSEVPISGYMLFQHIQRNKCPKPPLVPDPYGVLEPFFV
eukprot:PhF_6_TR29179/c0_g1_i1/m.42674